ncbi:uncharacterized protein ACLA_040930 [Aspergillus clavatus NRRL 1]|uniref:Uncharacterized protein n=1 Tax=Aspergillus clavatus (strain ATCC 1007 / CBS 513.65 / DSM 816 / NCTC 3887 / NRRL 1 / QM 1276 / 107) TaxID=344612 RepID=A1CL53_ASPCL|nr:uncharacterized protein ACLA_040930 [Aspergillus clavatus NRRL 1]EAW09877.1 conserved hypothetical protein [Aspergillus clavatus NRRL 1]
MGMGQTVKCVFRLTFLLKRAERSLPGKGKSVDHSHSLPPSGPYCTAGAGMPDHDDEDDVSSLGEDTDVDMGLYADPHLAVSVDAGSGSSSNNSSSSSKRRLVRVVSWTSIADRASARWTIAQERELAIAEQELARCQKAWSSEQELWLEYYLALDATL